MRTAAGFLAFDRYFGTSSGWIRYMTSLAAIERLRAEFLFDWTALLQKSPASIEDRSLLDLLPYIPEAVGFDADPSISLTPPKAASRAFPNALDERGRSLQAERFRAASLKLDLLA
jgi:hypothetical protein